MAGQRKGDGGRCGVLAAPTHAVFLLLGRAPHAAGAAAAAGRGSPGQSGAGERRSWNGGGCLSSSSLSGGAAPRPPQRGPRLRLPAPGGSRSGGSERGWGGEAGGGRPPPARPRADGCGRASPQRSPPARQLFQRGPAELRGPEPRRSCHSRRRRRRSRRTRATAPPPADGEQRARAARAAPPALSRPSAPARPHEARGAGAVLTEPGRASSARGLAGRRPAGSISSENQR